MKAKPKHLDHLTEYELKTYVEELRKVGWWAKPHWTDILNRSGDTDLLEEALSWVNYANKIVEGALCLLVGGIWVTLFVPFAFLRAPFRVYGYLKAKASYEYLEERYPDKGGSDGDIPF